MIVQNENAAWFIDISLNTTSFKQVMVTRLLPDTGEGDENMVNMTKIYFIFKIPSSRL